MGFLLCGWVAVSLWFRRCPDWDGARGIGRRLSVGGMGPLLHCLAPVSFQISTYSLILLPGIGCETDIKFPPRSFFSDRL